MLFYHLVSPNTLRATPQPGTNFAIPSDIVKKVVPELIMHGTHKQPRIGIFGADVIPDVANALGLKEANGVLVLGAIPSAPAAVAGISVSPPPHSEVIVGIDNKKVKTLADMLTYVESKSVGDTVVLSVLKDGTIHHIS